MRGYWVFAGSWRSIKGEASGFPMLFCTFLKLHQLMASAFGLGGSSALSISRSLINLLGSQKVEDIETSVVLASS